MKRTVFLLIVLALLVGAGAVSAQGNGPWRTYLPVVSRHCIDLGDSPVSQYQVPETGFRAQVQPADGCSRVEVRIFYRSIEFPGGYWTYWVAATWYDNNVYVPAVQDVGVIRHNELVEFRDRTGHGYEIVLMP